MSSKTRRALKPAGAGSPCNCTRSRDGTRLQLGGYVADIVRDHVESPFIHHCVVQRLGSPKVLYLAQEDSFAAALECGHHHLEELAMPHREKTGAIDEFTTADVSK